jgi:hypothetical protein
MSIFTPFKRHKLLPNDWTGAPANILQKPGRYKGWAIDRAVKRQLPEGMVARFALAKDDVRIGDDIIFDIKSHSPEAASITFSSEEWPAWCAALRAGKKVYLIVFMQTDSKDDFEFEAFVDFGVLKEEHLQELSADGSFFFRLSNISKYFFQC